MEENKQNMIEKKEKNNFVIILFIAQIIFGLSIIFANIAAMFSANDEKYMRLAIKATRELELEFGLTLTPTLGDCDKTTVRLTSGQIKKLSREAESGNVELPVKSFLAEHIPAAVQESDGTVESFIERLKARNVGARLNQAKTGHVSGISFKYDGIVVKGSKVARAFSWKSILELLKKKKGTGSYGP